MTRPLCCINIKTVGVGLHLLIIMVLTLTKNNGIVKFMGKCGFCQHLRLQRGDIIE